MLSRLHFLQQGFISEMMQHLAEQAQHLSPCLCDSIKSQAIADSPLSLAFLRLNSESPYQQRHVYITKNARP